MSQRKASRCHCCPVKLQSHDKNHRETKIPFPFLTTNLQPAETALHYFRRGWGHTSLAVAHMRDACKKVADAGWLKSLSWQSCLASVARSARHSFFTGQQCRNAKSCPFVRRPQITEIKSPATMHTSPRILRGKAFSWRKKTPARKPTGRPSWRKAKTIEALVALV